MLLNTTKYVYSYLIMLNTYKISYNLKLKDMLLSAGINKTDFSELTKIPICTINGWISKRNGNNSKFPCSVEGYLNLLIEYNQNSVFIEKLIKELKNYE